MTEGQDSSEDRDRLDAAISAVLLCIYLAQLVIIADALSDGALRREADRYWSHYVREPLRRRRQEVIARRQMLFEASYILDQAKGAA